MLLVLDIHDNVEGLTAEAVAGAHQRGVKYLKYGSTKALARSSVWSTHPVKRLSKLLTEKLIVV